MFDHRKDWGFFGRRDNLQDLLARRPTLLARLGVVAKIRTFGRSTLHAREWSIRRHDWASATGIESRLSYEGRASQHEAPVCEHLVR